MGEPIEQVFTVTADEGMIMIDGTTVAITLTAGTAKDLAEQLYAAVIVALGQQAATPPSP